jgi:hypothetical protein
VGRLLRFARLLLLIFTVTVAPASGAVAAGSSAVHHEYAYDAEPVVTTWHDLWTSADVVLAQSLGPSIKNASSRLRVTSGGRVMASADFVATKTGASNAANGVRLNEQLTAEKIAGGHAFDKHVIDQGEFPGVTTRSQFAQKIESVIRNGEAKSLSGRRTAWWDSGSGTVVIRNPGAVDGGTAFVPSNGRAYFDGLK